MEKERLRFIVYSILLVALLVLALWVIKPFILTIIAGLIAAYIFYPLHRRLAKRIKSKGWSAFIIAVLVIILFTVPLFFLTQAVVEDAYTSYIVLKQKSASLFTEGKCEAEGVGCRLINWAGNFMTKNQARFYFEDALSKVTQWLIDKANEIILKIPALMLQLVVFLFVLYYSLKEGDKVIKKMFSVLFIKEKHSATMMRKTKEMISSTIYGMLIVAGIQGALAGFGYFIFGVKSPVLLGILTALAALIPIVGTAIVWAPTVAVYLVDSVLSNNNTGILLALGLLVYSIFPVSTIDNFIRPKIIGNRAKMHPILVLLGILGGISAFGIVGVLLGPIILTFFVTFIDIYQEERLDHGAKG